MKSSAKLKRKFFGAEELATSFPGEDLDSRIARSRVDEAILDGWMRGAREDQKKKDGKKLKGISLEARQDLMIVKTVTINSGLRAAELTNLWWSDADFDRPTLAVTEKPDWQP